MRRQTAIAVVLAAVLLTSCSKRENAMVGTWTGRMTIDEAASQKAIDAGEVTQEQIDMGYEIFQSMGMTLDI